MFIFFPLWTVFAGGKPEEPASLSVPDPMLTQQGFFFPQGGTPGYPSESRQAENRAEMIFRAIAQAYPDRTGEPEFRDGEWTIEVYGERFYYADGRLLPASLRNRSNEYSPLPFYNYLRELPPWRPPTPEESALIREQVAMRRSQPLKRPSYFFDTLWRARNRDEAWDRVKQIRFLGKPVLVHYSILVQLSLVEQQILEAAKTSNAVRQYINNLNTAEGWIWRNIAATESRSFHAYGAAVDLLPRSLGGLQTYWQWTSQHTPEFWNVPYSRRFHPPDEVIKAFESFGFIWGGKWRYFDTMHFEYRPEILILNSIPMTDLRELR